MASSLLYKASVEGDLRRIGRDAARRVLERLEAVLTEDPAAGLPLSGEYRGLRKLRVGDYRVLYARVPEGVLVVRIAHRREAYR